MPDTLNYRVRPHPGGPFNCLTLQSTEKDPRQGSPLSAWMGRATEKYWPKRPSDHQLQEAQKKTRIGPKLLHWRQSVSLHTWHRQGPHKPSSWATFTLNSHWGRAATGKKVLHLCVQDHFGRVQLFAALWTVACLASLSGKGVLQASILERIGQYWLPHPSRALYFLLP